MLQFFGAHILMENTKSADFAHMNVHYQHIKEKYGTHIGFHKYKEIRASLEFTLEELEKLSNLLMTNSCRLM